MVTETKLTEELHFLREKIHVLEKLRLQGSSDSNLDCNQCGSPETEDQKRFPHIVVSTLESLSPVGTTLEEDLLDSVLAWMGNTVGTGASAHAFLEANSGVESCQRLLEIWDRLRPSARHVIALAAEVKTLQNDKEHLRINLTRAEEEAKVLFEENNIIEKEKKKLLRLYNRERHHHGSGGKSTGSASAKSNKRKSSPKICTSVEGMMEFDSPDSSRLPLSPLQYNTPDSRMHKK